MKVRLAIAAIGLLATAVAIAPVDARPSHHPVRRPVHHVMHHPVHHPIHRR